MGFFVVIAWFVLATTVGNAAVARGRSGAGWFVLALIFSPLTVVLLIAFVGAKAERDVLRRQAADDRALQRNIRIGRQNFQV